jgi:hypothetical protein
MDGLRESLIGLQASAWLGPVLIAAALIATAIAGYTAGMLGRRQRVRDVAGALDESTSARFVAEPSARGQLAGILTPAPEPYERLEVQFSMNRHAEPPQMARVEGPGGGQLLILSGRLRREPTAEIVWQRGHAANRALGRGSGSDLWVRHPVTPSGGEYAVRGANTHALEHAFAEYQRRFGRTSLLVSVERTGSHHVRVAVRVAGIDVAEIRALVGAIRALGRAALVE